jgi:hypothetical protein
MPSDEGVLVFSPRSTTSPDSFFFIFDPLPQGRGFRDTFFPT